MKKVFKYPLQMGPTNIELPYGAKIVLVAKKDDAYSLWAEVHPDGQREVRRFEIHGTGHPIPEDGRRHVASFIDGFFVWHLYELGQQ